MKFCPHCGNEIQPGIKFCGNCGKSVDSLSSQNVEPIPTTISTEKPVKVKKSKRKVFFGVLGLLMVTLVGVIYYQQNEARKEEAVKYCQYGNDSYSKGNFDEAIEYYKKSVEIYSEIDFVFYSVYLKLGDSYNRTSHYGEAILVFDKLIKAMPSMDGAYYFMGVSYRGKNNFNMAIPYFEKAIELDPKEGFFYFKQSNYLFLGNSYIEVGNPDKAIQILEKGLEYFPGSSFLHIELGNAYGIKGNVNKKITAYQKAAQLDDDDAKQWLRNRGYSW